MREIKFRAFSYGKRYLIYPEDFEWFGGTGGPQRTLTECNLMQYTGLKDKNGVEIYEGDILKLWRSVGEKGDLRGEYAYLLPVEYDPIWCQFVVSDEPNKIQYGIWQQFQAFEIIGNIYENPELLEVKQ